MKLIGVKSKMASRSFSKLLVVGRAGFPHVQTTANRLRGLASQHAVPMEVEVKEKDRASYMRILERIQKVPCRAGGATMCESAGTERQDVMDKDEDGVGRGGAQIAIPNPSVVASA